MSWTEEKIKSKRDYFKKERTEKKGKFTEFTVRTFYSICKACSENDGISCEPKVFHPRKIANTVYDGIYDRPDHDATNVINDCIDNLKNMHYIKFKKEGNSWVVYLNKPLDFLLPGEHERYLDKFGIISPLSYLSKK